MNGHAINAAKGKLREIFQQDWPREFKKIFGLRGNLTGLLPDLQEIRRGTPNAGSVL